MLLNTYWIWQNTRVPAPKSGHFSGVKSHSGPLLNETAERGKTFPKNSLNTEGWGFRPISSLLFQLSRGEPLYGQPLIDLYEIAFFRYFEVVLISHILAVAEGGNSLGSC